MKFRTASTILICFALSACSDSDFIPKGDPGESIRENQFGYTASQWTTIGAEKEAHWIQSLIVGFSAPKLAGPPAKVVPLEAPPHCRFPQPGPSEKLVHVQVGESRQNSNFYMVSRKEITDRAGEFVERYQRKGKDPGVDSNRRGDRLYVVDVVVTDTQAPLYLVLAAPFNVLWNMQIAPSVEIAQVALVGSKNVAIANLEPDTKRASLSGRQTERCQAEPFRQPASHWSLVKRARKDSGVKDELKNRYAFARAYSKWFKKNFGQSSEKDVIGMSRADHVLIGKPALGENRLPYKSLDGATFYVSRQDHIFEANKSRYKKIHSKLVRAQAKRLIGTN